MAHTTRDLILVIVLSASCLAVVGANSSRADSSTAEMEQRPSEPLEARSITATPAAQTTPDVEPLSVEQQEAVDWAIERFAQAGLELPELSVRFDSSREQCGYSEGRYHHEPHGERIVTICSPDVDTAAAQLQRRRTLLHEFGHAWDFANLSDEDHRELSGILGVDGWIDQDADWEDQGVERFAEAFVFALLDQPRRPLKVKVECTVLMSAFHAATGAAPLGPGLPSCAA